MIEDFRKERKALMRRDDVREAYLDYLSAFPAGQHVGEAIVALQRLGAIKGGSPTRGLRGEGSGQNGGLY